MTYQYILDENNNPVSCDDHQQWYDFYHSGRRRIGLDEVGCIKVSTVFLGIDHNWETSGPPILFETMFFNDEGEERGMMRYATWQEAVEGHKLALELAKEKAA